MFGPRCLSVMLLKIFFFLHFLAVLREDMKVAAVRGDDARGDGQVEAAEEREEHEECFRSVATVASARYQGESVLGIFLSRGFRMFLLLLKNSTLAHPRSRNSTRLVGLCGALSKE